MPTLSDITDYFYRQQERSGYDPQTRRYKSVRDGNNTYLKRDNRLRNVRESWPLKWWLGSDQNPQYTHNPNATATENQRNLNRSVYRREEPEHTFSPYNVLTGLTEQRGNNNVAYNLASWLPGVGGLTNLVDVADDMRHDNVGLQTFTTLGGNTLVQTIPGLIPRTGARLGFTLGGGPKLKQVLSGALKGLTPGFMGMVAAAPAVRQEITKAEEPVLGPSLLQSYYDNPTGGLFPKVDRAVGNFTGNLAHRAANLGDRLQGTLLDNSLGRGLASALGGVNVDPTTEILAQGTNSAQSPAEIQATQDAYQNYYEQQKQYDKLKRGALGVGALGLGALAYLYLARRRRRNRRND